MKQTDHILLRAPTDLSNFLGCRHLSALDLRVARGEAKRPARYDVVLEDLRARGLAHERAYLARLRDLGLTIAGADAAAEGVEAAGEAPVFLNAGATLAAMRSGVDVIYQATLEREAWSGRVDFLRKVDTPSQLGDWSYEAYDTKLARETKAGTILQLCVYSYLLEVIQGTRPAHMYVVTPGTNFVPGSYRTDDYGAYFRLLERGIDEFLAQPAQTYPELVSHCDYCAWWSECEARRRADDHLCYVAGISTAQIKSLRELNVGTLAALAVLEDVPEPARGSRDALVRVREQARIQKRGRDTGTPQHELKHPFDAEHGLALLPEPTADDIFLDFEGDHFSEQGVQEYLLGYVTRGTDGEPVYTSLWAKTLAEERAAFQRFMDLARDTRARNPAAHIYHFAPYEPDGIEAPDGSLRHARGRARPAAARSRVRGSARRRQACADCERRALFDQGSRAVLRLHARPGPARGEREPAGGRARDRRRYLGRRNGDAPADRRELQPRRLRIDAAVTGLARATAHRKCLPKVTRCRGRSPRAARRPRKSARSTARCSVCATACSKESRSSPANVRPSSRRSSCSHT